MNRSTLKYSCYDKSIFRYIFGYQSLIKADSYMYNVFYLSISYMTYKKLKHVDVVIISYMWVDNLNSKAEPSLQTKHWVKVQTFF